MYTRRYRFTYHLRVTRVTPVQDVSKTVSRNWSVCSPPTHLESHRNDPRANLLFPRYNGLPFGVNVAYSNCSNNRKKWFNARYRGANTTRHWTWFDRISTYRSRFGESSKDTYHKRVRLRRIELGGAFHFGIERITKSEENLVRNVSKRKFETLFSFDRMLNCRKSVIVSIGVGSRVTSWNIFNVSSISLRDALESVFSVPHCLKLRPRTRYWFSRKSKTEKSSKGFESSDEGGYWPIRIHRDVFHPKRPRNFPYRCVLNALRFTHRSRNRDENFTDLYRFGFCTCNRGAKCSLVSNDSILGIRCTCTRTPLHRL